MCVYVKRTKHAKLEVKKLKKNSVFLSSVLAIFPMKLSRFPKIDFFM